MNCQDFTALLDASGADALTAEASAHADTCANCREAAGAARALALDPIPPLRPAFVTELRTAFADASSPARRAWRPVAVVGAIGFAGAVFAGIALVTSDAWRAAPDAPQAPAPADSGARAGARGAETTDDSLIELVGTAEQTAHREFSERLLVGGSRPDGEYFAVLKVAPVYPAEAAAAGLEGYAIVEFTVTEDGDVTDVTAVDSSDAVFEANSIEAAQQFKYKPRVVDGRAVEIPGVRNKITYVLEAEPADDAGTDAADREAEEAEEARRSAEFRTVLAPALECLRISNLRCIELELEGIVATRDLNARERAEIDRIFGFVHFRRGNYQQAINAYESAAQALASEGGYLSASSLMIVARIHYELAQYQQALDAALQSLRMASWHPTASTYAFVDRLRQLGAVVR